MTESALRQALEALKWYAEASLLDFDVDGGARARDALAAPVQGDTLREAREMAKWLRDRADNLGTGGNVPSMNRRAAGVIDRLCAALAGSLPAVQPPERQHGQVVAGLQHYASRAAPVPDMVLLPRNPRRLSDEQIHVLLNLEHGRVAIFHAWEQIVGLATHPSAPAPPKDKG